MFGDLNGLSVLVGHLFRIPVFVHASTIFMLGWAYLWAGGPPASASGAEWYIIVLIVLIISLMLHEVGHALAYRMFGSQEIAIYLTGFGGLCVSTRGGVTVGRDLIVIAAGPAMNLVLAIFFHYSPELLRMIDPSLLSGGEGRMSLLLLFCLAAGFVNLGLFLVNIMPIYPLDGGRLVYSGSLIATGDRLLARQIALTVSILGAIAWFAWSTGLVAMLSSGGSVGAWLGTLGGMDIFFAFILFVLVRSAMQSLY